MKKNHTVALTTSIIEQCKDLPLTRSAAIAQSLMNAVREPELLILALRHRMSSLGKEGTEKVSYTRDTKLDEALETLMNLTEMSGEQVIRLSLEAYVYRLK